MVIQNTSAADNGAATCDYGTTQGEALAVPPPIRTMLNPGADEPYDTLDDLPKEWCRDMQSFNRHVLEPLTRSACGFVFGGMAALGDPNDGYWGEAMGLCTGETLQVRIMPRGAGGKGIPPDEDMVCFAFRRSCATLIPHVWCMVLFSPHQWESVETKEVPSFESYTAGCRGLHIILPSIFSEHDAQRDVGDTKPEHDANGFHTIRPYSISVARMAPQQTEAGKEVRFTQSITPGNSYMAVAGAMAGVSVPDPLLPPVIELTEPDMMRQLMSLQRSLSRGVAGQGKNADPNMHILAGLTVLDALTAEGVAGMLSHSFFRGALTDMMHSPIGLVLIIAMAMRIAAFPDIFGLGGTTPVDDFSSREVRAIFEARWGSVFKGRGLRAIDCALKAGFENATQRTNGEEHGRQCLFANLKYWQRLGQRMTTAVVSDTCDGGPAERERQLQTDYGRADLVADDVTAARYQALNKKGFARPLKEFPMNRVAFASRADVRTTVYRMHDSVEHWLRTGMYGEQRLSAANVNVASEKSNGTGGGRGGGDSDDDSVDDSSVDSDDCDDVLDNVLNRSAMESASGAISLALTQGGAVMHQFGIASYVVGPGATNKCADCDASVHVTEAVALNTRVGQCSLCGRHRCTPCQIKALRVRVLSPNVVHVHCKRCLPPQQSEDKKNKDAPNRASSSGRSGGGKKHACVAAKAKKEGA